MEITAYCGSHTKHSVALCGQSAKFLSATTGSRRTYVIHYITMLIIVLILLSFPRVDHRNSLSSGIHTKILYACILFMRATCSVHLNCFQFVLRDHM